MNANGAAVASAARAWDGANTAWSEQLTPLVKDADPDPVLREFEVAVQMPHATEALAAYIPRRLLPDSQVLEFDDVVPGDSVLLGDLPLVDIRAVRGFVQIVGESMIKSEDEVPDAPPSARGKAQDAETTDEEDDEDAASVATGAATLDRNGSDTEASSRPPSLLPQRVARRGGRKRSASEALDAAGPAPQRQPYTDEQRAVILARWRVKRVRTYERLRAGEKERYDVRKDFANTRVRIGGRFVSATVQRAIEKAAKKAPDQLAAIAGKQSVTLPPTAQQQQQLQA
jgi:hypothetical protein